MAESGHKEHKAHKKKHESALPLFLLAVLLFYVPLVFFVGYSFSLVPPEDLLCEQLVIIGSRAGAAVGPESVERDLATALPAMTHVEAFGRRARDGVEY